MGGARIAYTKDPTGTWITKDMWHGDTDACINYLANGDGYFLVGGYYYNSNTQFAKIGYTDPNSISIPVISPNGVYAYIKAKN